MKTTLTPYEKRVQANTEGLAAVSTGVCPGCETCRDQFAPDATKEEFDELVSSGQVFDEGGFSWRGCDICGSSLGGTVEVWHYIDENGDICHEDNACVDCVCYLANGDLPEDAE